MCVCLCNSAIAALSSGRSLLLFFFVQGRREEERARGGGCRAHGDQQLLQHHGKTGTDGGVLKGKNDGRSEGVRERARVVVEWRGGEAERVGGTQEEEQSRVQYEGRGGAQVNVGPRTRSKVGEREGGNERGRGGGDTAKQEVRH